jgi:hypothetical protein
LEDGEKVVFTAKLSMLGTETDLLIGTDARFTLTNRRIITDNGPGLWRVDISDDVVSWTRVQGGFILKHDYSLVMLNEAIVYDDGKSTMNGFHFYFKKKKDAARLEEIVNKLSG